MTAYVAIADADIDPESPITATIATRWRDNPIAITEGSSGAPKIQTAAIQDLAVTRPKLGGATAGDYLTMPLGNAKTSGVATLTPQKVLEHQIGRAGSYRTITKHAFLSLNLPLNRHCAIYRNGTLVVDNTVAIISDIGNVYTSYFTNDTSGWVAGDLLQVYIWTDRSDDPEAATCRQLILEGSPIVNSAIYTNYYTAGAW